MIAPLVNQPTLNRSMSFDSRTSSSANQAAPRKVFHYFSKPIEKTETEINQANSIERLSKNKLHRRKIVNDYEQPVSGRETWWRSTIKETPSPFRYNIPGFFNELVKRPNTYRFKSDGRRHDPIPQQGRGAYLLPGAYGYEDFAQKLKKLNISYGFKNSELSDNLNSKSNPDLGPFSYETEKIMSLSSSKEPAKHSFFKSKDKRNIFVPKEGPCPGEYEEQPQKIKYEVSSCFKSKSDRFEKKEFQTPGPGQYEPISAWINSKQTQDFNRKGTFFTPSAKVLT